MPQTFAQEIKLKFSDKSHLTAYIYNTQGFPDFELLTFTYNSKLGLCVRTDPTIFSSASLAFEELIRIISAYLSSAQVSLVEIDNPCNDGFFKRIDQNSILALKNINISVKVNGQ
jgi:hypothetical protein